VPDLTLPVRDPTLGLPATVMRKAILLAAIALVSVRPYAVAAGHQDDADPWAYVYVFRTATVFPLGAGDNRIGRLPENEITMSSSRVSRRHAVIRKSDSAIEFVDIGSSNGSRVNSVDVHARVPVQLSSGDRIQVADELMLFHETLDSLWNHELRLRLLGSLVTLRLDLPQDHTRKSLGRELIMEVVTEATLNTVDGRVDVDYHGEIDPTAGFEKETTAFIGNAILTDGMLELSIWAIDGEGAMTSRRSSISRLKHATLRVATDAGRNPNASGNEGPWYPQGYLANLFDLLPEDRDLSLRYSRSLTIQDRPKALRDAAETLYFRHHLSPSEPEILLMAVQSKGEFVDKTCIQKKMSLTDAERLELAHDLEEARSWLARARELGSKGKEFADTEAVVDRATSRLRALNELQK